jgi:hypothetical protein
MEPPYEIKVPFFPLSMLGCNIKNFSYKTVTKQFICLCYNLLLGGFLLSSLFDLKDGSSALLQSLSALHGVTFQKLFPQKF